MDRLQRFLANAPKLGKRPPVDLEAVEAAMSNVPQYCGVVTAQLDDIVKQTDEAARDIIVQLSSVDGLAEAMAGDVGDLVQTLSRTETELNEVNTSTQQLVSRLVNFFVARDNQVRQLVAEIRGLDRHITAIEAEITRNGITGNQGRTGFIRNAARTQRLPIDIGHFEIRREHQIGHGVVDHTGNNFALDHGGNRDTPEGKAAGKICGAIDRVDIPLNVAIADLSTLLAHDRRIGLVFEDEGADGSFGALVVNGDNVVQINLVVDGHV